MYSVLVFMTQRLLWPLTELGETLDLYQRGVASIRRILDLLDTPIGVVPGPRSAGAARAGAPPSREVAFEDVRFGYGDGPAVLDGLDAGLRAGETHAIVGATGAGKSTRRQVAAAVLRRARGPVRVDGVESASCTFGSLRGAIGYVGQDTFLFHGTVPENLATARRTRRRGAASARPSWPRRTSSSSRCPTATTPRSASAARGCGRAAPAAVDRPRAGARPADPDPRRSDLGGRQRDRGRDPALAAARRPSARRW